MKRLFAPLLAAVLSTVVFTGLLYVDFAGSGSDNSGRNFFSSLDNRLFDFLLRLKPPVEEDQNIVLLEIDDETITTIDMYPLGRDITADGLILLKEFEPAWTMLDIEFVDRSPTGIDLNFLDYSIPSEIQASYTFLAENNSQLITNILNGLIDRRTALEYMEQLAQMGEEESNRLYSYIRQVAIDRDAYLGRAVGYLGQVSVTLNITEVPSSSLTQEERDFAAGYFSVDGKLQGDTRMFPSDKDILPSIPQVITPAAWAGYPRMHIDSDGVRRRVDILYRSENDGHYYTHMGFGTWWLRQGDGTLEGAPPIQINKRSITINGTRIPLDRHGKLLINWPKRMFDGTPLNNKEAALFDPATASHRLQFLKLWYHDVLWDDILLLIDEMENVGLDAQLTGHTDQPLSAYASDLSAMHASMLEAADGSRAAEYGEYREQFLHQIEDYLQSGVKEAYLQEISAALENPDLSADMAALYEEDLSYIPELFDELLWRVQDILVLREQLREQVSGATIVVGYTGTSTTDYGANPFEKKYMNMGIYGAVYNSLVQGSFLEESPAWLTFAAVLLCGILMTFIGQAFQKKSGLNTFAGILFMLIIWAGGGFLFVTTGFYLNMLPLILVLLTTYLTTQAVNYLTVSRKRAEIQSMFGQVISPVVVEILEKNPELMNTAGEKRFITAMFSDIEGFSTITEYLGSTDRVFEFLERYLGPLCDIILDEQGTIDKFEGDAIIAFWNAPLDQERHAFHACHAVMRMAEKEKQLHQEFVERGYLSEKVFKEIRKRNPESHGRLFTRFGINSGENNVGFIGTQGRKDYTALGDEMNLAARLEGVNKLYATQALISNDTKNIISDEFFTRRMDKVRVVGRNKPVNLHQLSYSKDIGGFTEQERQGYVKYQAGLDMFYEQQWNDAEKLFKEAQKLMPGDVPSRLFIERCKNYRKKAPPKNWDGVYRMETK